ncbi:MAG: PP2C family serine/threonine-protein phosphatase [Oscillospiraceae bacterium]|nr:PP2C family serine/threonine-protein phosphatase [Oscillospiraceae bacterium]
MIDNLLNALRKIGVTDIPLDMLSISENVQQAQELLDKINNSEICNVTDLVSYFGKIPDKKYEKMFSNSITVVDVDPSELRSISDEKENVIDEPAVSDHEDLKQQETIRDDEKKPEASSEAAPKNVMDKTSVLWKYKPVPEDDPEPYPEYVKKYEKMQGSCVTAARVRGRKHKHEGTNCDDWFETSSSGNWTIAAVSDGAGSRKFSRIGAKESCTSAVAYIKETLAGSAAKALEHNLSLPMNDPEFMAGCSFFAQLIQDSVQKAFESLENAYNDRQAKFEYLKLLGRDMDIKDLACTLLICMILPVKVNNKQEHFVLSCQIGDGMICSVNSRAGSDSALKLLGEADSGEYSGETDFITSEAARRRESLMGKTKIMRGAVTDILLMTDGVADDYFPNDPQLLRFEIDLMLNGIIRPRDTENTVDKETAEKIPQPVCYPWVNDNEVKVASAYASRVAGSLSISVKELWDKPEIIKAAGLEAAGCDLPVSPDERLQRWLDNYSERGSFDDRTAVVISLNCDK